MATMASHSQHITHGSISFSSAHDPLPSPSKPFDMPSRSSSPRTPNFDTDMLSTSGPLPNPPFVFPARQPASSAPSSFSRATGRRPKSAFELQGPGPGFSSTASSQGRSVPAPLPSFSFNPTATAESGISSPPQSPHSPTGRTIPRSGGHKRGGSEFIGGDGKTGTGTILMSTSPTKSEADVTTPTATSSLGPSAGRRGHAHRRSAAISCHDLSMILQPTPAKGVSTGSAPATPSENDGQRFNFPSSPKHALTTSISEPNNVMKLPVASPPESPKQGQSRARVGFSDTLEFIPRPLSLVSSDTSSTATARPGHSVSGSISSIVSGGAASPQSKDARNIPSPSHSMLSSDSRPSTAGAILGTTNDMSAFTEETMGHKRRNSLPLASDDSGNTSPDAAISPRGPRKFNFFGLSEAAEQSPVRSRPASSAGSDKPKSDSSAPSSPAHVSNDDPIASIEPGAVTQRRPSLTRKPSKKQKKVRSWAGSILSRKSRSRGSKKALSRRSPTPPLRNYDSFEPPMGIATPPTIDENLPEIPLPLAPLNTTFASWKPRHIAPPEDDTMSPIIDLDAALGPFNTETALSYDPDWEASQRSGRGIKKRMHSGAPTRGYRANDLPFHRRSESAPEMDNPRFSMHRLGSSSTMADVFEEEEEDDEWEETKTVSHKSSKAQVDEEDLIGVNVVESDSGSEVHAMDWTTAEVETQRGVKRKGSGLSEGERRQVSGGSAKSVRSTTSIKDEPIFEELESPVEIADELSPMRDDSETKSSDSTLTPPLRAKAPKELAPVEIQSALLPQPFLTPASSNSTFQSPFPSPRSPMSYDAQRISTAPSSFTEEHTFESLLLGEPGPEIRMSVDDVPSLTSSTSTMTRDSINNAAISNPQFRNGQRSASLSAPSVQQKRSSIASLSRLLHSSHGEKSPLSSEFRAPESPEKKEKAAKGKRLSRMMNFFSNKSKDTSSNS